MLFCCFFTKSCRFGTPTPFFPTEGREHADFLLFYQISQIWYSHPFFLTEGKERANFLLLSPNLTDPVLSPFFPDRREGICQFFASLRVNFRAELNRRFVPIFCLSEGQFQGRIKPKVCADFFAFRRVNFRAELNRSFVPIFLPFGRSISGQN